MPVTCLVDPKFSTSPSPSSPWSSSTDMRDRGSCRLVVVCVHVSEFDQRFDQRSICHNSCTWLCIRRFFFFPRLWAILRVSRRVFLEFLTDYKPLWFHGIETILNLFLIRSSVGLCSLISFLVYIIRGSVNIRSDGASWKDTFPLVLSFSVCFNDFCSGRLGFGCTTLCDYLDDYCESLLVGSHVSLVSVRFIMMMSSTDMMHRLGRNFVVQSLSGLVFRIQRETRKWMNTIVFLWFVRTRHPWNWSTWIARNPVVRRSPVSNSLPE